MPNQSKSFSLTSIRFALTGGVALCLFITASLIGGISILGGLNSAIDLTRAIQKKKTEQLSGELTTFANSLRREAATISEVIGLSASELKDGEIIDILSTYARHKPALTSITLVRKNRTNIWVGRWRGEVIHEINTELDEESYSYAINGKPNDGSEGFEEIYIEPSERRPVITYTKHFSDKSGKPLGTIYIDLGLKILSQRLSNVEANNLEQNFVFDANGSVIAHHSFSEQEAYKIFEEVPHIDTVNDFLALEVYNRIMSGNLSLTDLKLDDKQWLISVATNTGIGDQPWYSISAIPRNAVLGPALKQAQRAIFFTLLIMALSIVVCQFIGRSIVRSLEQLVKAADSVERLELEVKLPSKSYFDEIKRTQNAFKSMIGGLEIFAKYVPSALVRRLMELQSSGGTVQAEEREVTILFTDIAGYTSIADGMEPAQLAVLLNDYFELLVSVVSRHGGTVDKFIGDALMVFWNAPDLQSEHADLAINCALDIRHSINLFNQERLKRNRQPLNTRIGVHTGTVLVGEIGSSDRLNYTIVGDSVNTAARLEALGKALGQTLCVSCSTKNQSKGYYSWQEVDRIVLRGRSDFTTIYTVI